MRLNRNELETLLQITRSESPLRPQDLTKAFGLQPGSVSRLISQLEEKGLVDREDGRVILAKAPPAESFKRLYYAHRASPFKIILCDRRIGLLSKLDQSPKSSEELAEITGIPLKTVYHYLKDFALLGIVTKRKGKRGHLHSLNYAFWPELKEFVTTLLQYDKARLVPREALLIRTYEDCVLFKSLRPEDATPTSFSAYGEYGIELDMRDRYYTLPKRELSIEEIFIHSSDSAEDLSQRLFCVLFYLKNRDKLELVDHPRIMEIRAVLQGDKIKEYPSLEEIRDRADLYGIEL
jgi:DNA-binding MarR family transcriptional regulator